MTPSIEQAIRKRISRERCPVHHEQAEVLFNGDMVTLNCCCESFNQSLAPILQQTVGECLTQELERRLMGL